MSPSRSSDNADLGHISVPAVQQYLASAAAGGVDTAAGLALAGISASELARSDARIDGARFETLLHWLIDASRDPVFGLHTSAFIQPGSYSVLGYMAMSSANLLDAIRRMLDYEKLVGDMGVSRIEPLPGGRMVIHWQCRYPRQPVRRHLIENVFGSWLRYVRWLGNAEDRNPLEVWFEHAPPATGTDDYAQLFRCPLRFNQPVSAMVTDLATLSQPLRQPDPALCATLELHARTELARLATADTYAGQVRRQLRASLAHQLPRQEHTAAALGLHARTLHRRLLEEGTSWQQLLEELRAELSCRYLADASLGLADIASRLGYSDVRSFQRGFKRQQGMSPGEWRQRQETR